VPAIPSWLLEPLWDQFAALLPDRPAYEPAHPLGCHRRRIADRIVSGKLLQVRSVIGTVGWRATNPRRSPNRCAYHQ
jgi:hypothetical protein